MALRKQAERALRIDDRRAPDGLRRPIQAHPMRLQASRPAVQLFDGLRERAFRSDRGRKGGGMNPKMFGQKAGADRLDRGTGHLVLRLDGDVAFRIETHGPVVEVGRADPKQAIIHDHQFGVHKDVLAVRHDRREDVQTPEAINPFQAPQQTVAVPAHEQPFDQAPRVEVQNDHHFGPVGLLQALRQNVPRTIRAVRYCVSM